MVLNLSDRRVLIVNFVSEHPELSLYECANRLKSFNIPSRSVYRVGAKVRNGENITNYSNCGRKPTKMTARKLKQFKKLADGWTGSQRELAAKFNICDRYCRELLEKFKIKAWKRRDSPKSTPEQFARQMARLKIMTNELVPVNGLIDIIEDDESYFSLSGKGNKYFLASSPENLPIEKKTKPRAKFEARLCVWIAISRKGHSDPFFVPANCAVNSEIYRNQCIEKRLVPFITENYQNHRYLFWPDGASCHYHRETIKTLEKFEVEFVKKNQNPPNVPQLRCIEKFWAHLKQKVYQNNWCTTSFEALKKRIKSKLTEFDLEYFERLFENEKTKIAQASVEGPLSVIFNN